MGRARPEGNNEEYVCPMGRARPEGNNGRLLAEAAPINEETVWPEGNNGRLLAEAAGPTLITASPFASTVFSCIYSSSAAAGAAAQRAYSRSN
jgi:hypothetical protein